MMGARRNQISWRVTVWKVLSPLCLGSTMSKVLKNDFSPPKAQLRYPKNNWCETLAGHTREGILRTFYKPCSCEPVAAWGKALQHTNVQEREGKVFFSGRLLDTVHSVKCPRTVKCDTLHADTAFSDEKGKGWEQQVFQASKTHAETGSWCQWPHLATLASQGRWKMMAWSKHAQL